MSIPKPCAALLLLLLLIPAAAFPAAAPPSIAGLIQKGEDNLRQGRLATADTSFREALRLALQAGDRAGEASARNGIARTFAADLPGCLTHLRLAQEIHWKLSDPRGEAADLAAIGTTYHRHGQYAKAAESLEAALALEQRLGLKTEEARTRSLLGGIREAWGAYEAAEAHYTAALQLGARTLLPEELYSLHVRLGNLLGALGRYEAAEEQLQGALEIGIAARSRFSPEEWARLQEAWVSQGQRFYQNTMPAAGKLGGALFGGQPSRDAGDAEFLARRSRIFAEEHLPDVGFTAAAPIFDALLPLMLQFAEESQEAITRAMGDKAMSVALTLAASPDCEMALSSSLGRMYSLSGHRREAEAARQRAWKLREEQLALQDRFLPGGVGTSPLLAQDAAARQLGLPLSPRFYADKCGESSQAKNELWEADFAAAEGRPDAGPRYQKLADAQPAVRPEALTRLAALYEKQGDKPRALAAYRQAIDAVEAVQGALRLEQLVESWSSQQAPLYARTLHLLRETGDAKAGFEMAERARARGFLQEIGNRRLPASVLPEALSAELYQVRQKLIELETQRRRPAPEPTGPKLAGFPTAPPPDRRGEEEAARRQYEQLLARVAQANPRYLSLVQVDTVSLDTVQKEILPAETTLVEFFVLEGKTLAWVIDREQVQWIELAISSQTLRQKVGYLRELIASRNPAAKELEASLYQALFAPLEPAIRHPNLILVPHRELNALPFAALWDAARGRYLIERYNLAFAPSASVLRHVAQPAKTGAQLLALGNPDGSLPHAEQEARAIGQLYGTAPLLGKEARESRLRQSLAGVGNLHIAAHATFDPRSPRFSRLELAADPGASPTDEASDGKLHTYEIYDLDLREAPLVVLSACDTGLHLREEDQGDDLVGLTRAFLAAGAHAVVATLWPVDDAATTPLMKSFYERQRQGARPAEALREAQKELLAQERWREPYYWAAFTFTGRP